MNEFVAIYFYSSLEEPYGCFSNFSRHGVEIDNVYYKTCEHYFQAMKFDGSTKDMEDVRPKIWKMCGAPQHPSLQLRLDVTVLDHSDTIGKR